MMRKMTPARGGAKMGANKAMAAKAAQRNMAKSRAGGRFGGGGGQNQNSAANAQMRMMQQNSRRDMANINNMMGGGMGGMPPPYMMSPELNNFEHLSPYSMGGDPSAPMMYDGMEGGMPMMLSVPGAGNQGGGSEVGEGENEKEPPLTMPEYPDFFKKTIPLKRATKYIALALMVVTCIVVVILIVFEQFG